MAVALLPNGTYHYDWNVGGHSVGSSTILIRRSGGTLDVGESGSLPGRTIISERKIPEATFANLSYVADANGKHVVLTFAGNEATLAADGQHHDDRSTGRRPISRQRQHDCGFRAHPGHARHDRREAVYPGLRLRRRSSHARDRYRSAAVATSGHCAR